MVKLSNPAGHKGVGQEEGLGTRPLSLIIPDFLKLMSLEGSEQPPPPAPTQEGFSALPVNDPFTPPGSMLKTGRHTSCTCACFTQDGVGEAGAENPSGSHRPAPPGGLEGVRGR